jgi:hypothetical protein
MNSIDIYRAIRSWENMRSIEISILREFYKINSNNHKKYQEDENIRILMKCRRDMKEIEELFLAESTDVEYIVTTSYPKLKSSGWLYNYYIEKNKIEYSGYEYKIYRGSKSEIEYKSFGSLEEAVTEILSIASDVSDRETVTEAIQKLNL